MADRFIEEVSRYRQSILLACAGALLHNLGKTAGIFVKHHLVGQEKDGDKSGNEKLFFFEQVAGLIKERYLPDREKFEQVFSQKLADLFWSRDDITLTILDSKTKEALFCEIPELPPPFGSGQVYHVGDLIEFLGVGRIKRKDLYDVPETGDYGKTRIEQIVGHPSYLTDLMYWCHHGASGSEKQYIGYAQQTPIPDLDSDFRVYLATPFGYEAKVFNHDSYKRALNKLEMIIQDELVCTDRFSLSTFAQKVKPWLSEALGDTQRPLNDVTVWDIGHSGMAFLKSAIWSIAQHSPQTYNYEKSCAWWRVLSYQLNGLEFLNQANSIPDLFLRKKLLTQELDKMRYLLEEKYPLATEVYRDENGSIYIFPDLDWNGELQHFFEYSDTDRKLGLSQVYGVKPSLVFDPNHTKTRGPYYQHPNENPYIGKKIGEIIDQPVDTKPDLAVFSNDSLRTSNQDLCPHCGVRSIGAGIEMLKDARDKSYADQAIALKSCCVCMDRRERRAKDWLDSVNKAEVTDTIWIDEATDINNKLSLVVASWDLNAFFADMYYPSSSRYKISFQNGTLSPGSRIQIDPRKSQDVLRWDKSENCFIMSYRPGQEISALRKHGELEVGGSNLFLEEISEQGDDLVLHLQTELDNRLHPGTKVRVLGQDCVVVDHKTLKTLTEDAKKTIYESCCWKTTDNKYVFLQRCPIVIGSLSESFARMRRVWSTTKQFWESVLEEFRPAEPSLHYRLALFGTCRHGNLIKNQTYELKLGQHKLSVFWDGQCFITIDNLQYISGPTKLNADIETWLKQHSGQPLQVFQPTGYGASDQHVADFVLNADSGIVRKEPYNPVIKILAEPQTFMVLVPANESLRLVNLIRQKYEREMGKKRHQLPLHIGVVFASGSTPLRLILDAGRRMLKTNRSKEENTKEENTKEENAKEENPKEKNKKRKNPNELWRVISSSTGSAELLPEYLKKDPHFSEWQEVKLANDCSGISRTLVWRVPRKMGDGETSDDWYPFVTLEEDQSGESNQGKSNQKAELVHVKDLDKLGPMAIINFVPATFDYEILDTGGRRFEIAYDDNGRRLGSLGGRRPYLLDDLSILESMYQQFADGLARSQIYRLRDTIEAKRLEWNISNLSSNEAIEVFRQFCKDLINRAPWYEGKKPTDITELSEYVARGWLADALELMTLTGNNINREGSRD